MINKFILVAPLSSLSKRLRLFKISRFVYKELCTNIAHFSWERVQGESEEVGLGFKPEKKILLRGGGYGGKKNKVMYFLWMWKVFLSSFTIKKNDVVWALGFESAFPLLLLSRIKGFKIFFDDADRFSMLFNQSFFTNIISLFEKVTSRNVYKHIIPSKARYGFNSDRFFLLQNTPSEIELINSYKIYKEKTWINAQLVVCINGWLSSDRGMDIALKLSKELINNDVAFILVGQLECSDAIQLSQQGNVQYIGTVSNAEALAAYYASDFVFTYYNPKKVINIYAASNKWGDAIKTNIGIIVNSEVITADFLIRERLTISYQYEDYMSVASELRKFCADRQRLKLLKQKMNSISNNYPYYEYQLKELFSTI